MSDDKVIRRDVDQGPLAKRGVLTEVVLPVVQTVSGVAATAQVISNIKNKPKK